MPAKFSSEPYVIQHADDIITMRADGTGERLLTTSISVQSEAALRELSVLTIVFSSKTETADFTYVRVIHSDGSVQETPVSSAMEQPAPVTQQAPVYSDLQTRQIPVRSMRVGDRLEWQAKFLQTVADAPNQFWFQSTFTTTGIRLDDNVELRVPTGLRVSVWTNPRAHAEFTESDQNGQHIYRWHHANLSPTVGPEAEAAKKKEAKRVRTADEELDDTKGELASLGWTTLPDWPSVGTWFRGLLTDRITPDDAIKAKVAELTAGKSTELEKSQAIYSFVSTHIRYIGVDFGIGRFQPHTAAEVFANQFGDCKDKHVLLASMLSVIGVQADPVLIGANVRFNSALPAPLSFNHVITRATVDGKSVFLDATAEIGIWAALLQPLRDHQALLVPATGPAVVAQTPADLPFAQTSTFKVVGSLDNDLTSDSAITLTVRGDAELILRPLIRSISPANYSEFVQRFMASIGFGGTTSDPSFDNVDDPGKPLAINFHYHRVKEKDWGENRITATFLNIALPYFNDENPATSTIQLGAPRTETSTVELILPKGWNAGPPENIHAHAPFANCDVTYEHWDGKLLEERRLTVLNSEVPVKDAKPYLAWYDECGAGSYPYIQLFPAPKVSEKAMAAGPIPATAIPTGPAKPPDSHAAELIEKALSSMRNFDMDGARVSLDEAARLNPGQLHLWTTYAALSAMLGVRTKAVLYTQREINYHPDELELYPALVTAQLDLTDQPGALATMRLWVKAAPTSPEAALALTRQLEQTGHHAEALRNADAALARLVPDEKEAAELRIVAAKAEVALGHPHEAAARITPMLDTLSDPERLNDLINVLADTGEHLEQAARAEIKLIAQTESGTENWALGEPSPAVSQQQYQLGHAWDTMGWILYREGKLEDAYGYAAAASLMLGDSAVQKHYASIAAGLHHPTDSPRADGNEHESIPFTHVPSNGRSGLSEYTVLLEGGKLLDLKLASGASTADNVEKDIRLVDWHRLFPIASKARQLRKVLIFCHTDTCDIQLGRQQLDSHPFDP